MSENRPAATAALAQTQEGAIPKPAPPRKASAPDGEYCLAPELTVGAGERPYERSPGDPVYRRLKIFTLDPSASRLEGAIATLEIPYERVGPGPVGAVFAVDNYDGTQYNRRVDLDDRFILLNGGMEPTPSDPRFHQQMVYAVASSVYAAFRTALGRHITWSFGRPLLLRPHALREEKNAFYDKNSGSVQFGYYRAPESVAGRNLPRSWVFTCLSHDIVAHEVSHALLDALRANFTVPSNPDVPAFHEALADLIAVFQHFSYRDVLEQAIARSRGNLQAAPLLTALARQFAQTQEGRQGEALRDAVHRDQNATPPRYGAAEEPHALGSVLVSAVFRAFTAVYERKVKRVVRLATGGSGVLPEGDLSPYLVSALADQAAKLASQFLSICIRAVDYCPPVDLLFGEYLRALITADYALVPDDRWCYREALVDAFREHGIHPVDVPNLSEDALLWRAPEERLPVCSGLSFAELRFRGDPSLPAGPDEVKRQARELGRFIMSEGRNRFFGLVTQAESEREGLGATRPCVHSIRSTRRVGPDGQVVFDLIAEVTQSRVADGPHGPFRFYGGATIILDAEGGIRYVVAKGIRSPAREQRQIRFLETEQGKRLSAADSGSLFRLLHKGE